MAFTEGMYGLEDEDIYEKIAAEVGKSKGGIEKAYKDELIQRVVLGIFAGYGGKKAIEADPTKPKTNPWLGKRFKDIEKRPDPTKWGETSWTGIQGEGGHWRGRLSPRYHVNRAYKQNEKLVEPPSGFPQVFRPLDSGGYGYGWPTSVEEHPRFRGTIPGTDIPYGPPKITSDADRAEVNVAYQEKRKWLLQMIRFWEGKNPIKAANYRTELENLSEDDF